jgi:alkylation response protein AidB-like acyl-CoA dehydrogenase
VREAAQAYSQGKLAPRAMEAFRRERTDPEIFREMGELGLLGATVAETYGGAALNYASYGLIARENDSPFGLSTGICTRSHRASREFVRRARSGLAMVNVPTGGLDYHVPFGGTRGSSYGPREQGHMAIEFYTQVKTAFILP